MDKNKPDKKNTLIRFNNNIHLKYIYNKYYNIIKKHSFYHHVILLLFIFFFNYHFNIYFINIY